MIDHLECHSSVLAPGAVPQPPHPHPQEELLVIVAGEAELITARDETNGALTRTQARLVDVQNLFEAGSATRSDVLRVDSLVYSQQAAIVDATAFRNVAAAVAAAAARSRRRAARRLGTPAARCRRR